MSSVQATPDGPTGAQQLSDDEASALLSQLKQNEEDLAGLELRGVAAQRNVAALELLASSTNPDTAHGIELQKAQTDALDIKGQIQQHRERVFNIRQRLNPTHRTPTEILSLIFTECIDKLTGDGFIAIDDASIRARQLQPFHLSQVCSAWRGASLITRELWLHIDYSLPDADSLSRSQGLHFSRLYRHLERSRTSALCLRLIASGTGTTFNMHLILDLVTRSAELYIASSLADGRPLNGHLAAIVLTMPTPSLEVLVIAGPAVLMGGGPAILSTAPRLRSIMTVCALHSRLVHVLPALRHVNQRGISGRIPVQQLRTLLQSAPSLVSLILDHTTLLTNPGNAMNTPTPHSNLRDLSIVGATDLQFQGVVVFDFPSLERLTLCGGDRSMGMCFPSVSLLLERFPSIRELVLSKFDGVNEAVLSVCRSIGLLKLAHTIEFQATTFRPQVLELIADMLLPTATPILNCPLLHTIKWTSCAFGADEVATSGLAAAVAARRASAESTETSDAPRALFLRFENEDCVGWDPTL